jgi:hypothetical protein
VKALTLLAGFVALAAVPCAVPSRANAQDSVPPAQTYVPDAHPPEERAWGFSITPYGWLNAVQGRVGSGGTTTDVDVSFGDVLDRVDLGLAGVFEARHRRWVGLLDVVYSSLTSDQQNATETIRALLDQVTLQPELGYTLVERPWGGIDGLVGARFWNFNLDIKVIEGSIENDVASGDQNWLDGTLGARVRYSAPRHWHLFFRGDAGAGGSDFTWQVQGGAGYDLGTCCVARAAYRHLDVDYESDDFISDIYLTGPTLGLEIKF